LRRKADALDEEAVARVGVEEIVGGVTLDPEHVRRVLLVACFEECDGPFAVAELGVEECELDWGDVVRF